MAGFIVTNTVKNDPRIAYLIEQDIPFTSFGRANDEWDYCWVDVNGFAAIQSMVQHLVERGHEKIAYIGWNASSYDLYTGQHREDGYKQGLQQAGLTFDTQRLIRGQDAAQTGSDGLKQLLSLPTNQRPTAVVCASDLVAAGALNGAMEAGLEVGRDMAITGYDNVPMTELLTLLP